MNVELIGFTAGFFIAVALAPQVIKAVKTRSTNDISLLWMLINITGQVLWVVYGVAIQSTSLYVMSGVTLAMALVLLGLKLKYDR